MSSDKTVKEMIGKKMCYLLRHKKGFTDEQGWVSIGRLVSTLSESYGDISSSVIRDIIDKDEKKRYAIQGRKIRANQGHSTGVNLHLTPNVPPNILYHGTTNDYLERILTEGIEPKSRDYVHLSPDLETARKVSLRRTKEPIILCIDAKKMHESGCSMYLSENGVWLTRYVSPRFLKDKICEDSMQK